MWRKRLAIVILLSVVVLAFVYPLIESFDTWDAPGPDSDSEIQIIALLTLLGAVIVFSGLLTALMLVPTQLSARASLPVSPFTDERSFWLRAHTSTSPPLLLRV